jgi:hypothetical protein
LASEDIQKLPEVDLDVFSVAMVFCSIMSLDEKFWETTFTIHVPENETQKTIATSE